MLVIKKIKLLLFKLNRRKILSQVRLGYESSYSNNKTNPALVDRKIIQWKQDITLPLYLHKTLSFEFYPKHEFGYNPEEIQSIVYGSAIIVNFDKKTYEGEVVDEEGESVGKFAFEFQVINDKRISETKPERTLCFSSILVQLENYQDEKGYIEFKNNAQSVYTPQIKGTQGQLVWVQPLLFPLYPSPINNEEVIRIKIYINDQHVASAELPFFADKKQEKYKRLELRGKKDDEKCGIMIMSYKYQNRTKNNSTTKLPTIKSTSRLKTNSKSERNIKRKENYNIKSVQIHRKYKMNYIAMFQVGQRAYKHHIGNQQP